MLLDLGQSLLVGLVLAGVGRIDFRQPNLCSGLDHKLLSIIHPGCSRYDAACSRSVWFTMCMLLACPRGPVGAEALAQQSDAAEHEHPGDVVEPHPADQGPGDRRHATAAAPPQTPPR